MIRARDHDVPLPKIPLHAPLERDGSTDTSIIYQAYLCTLIEIVGEAKSKVASCVFLHSVMLIRV